MLIQNPIVDENRRSSDPFVTYYKDVYYSCYCDVEGVYVSYCHDLSLLRYAKEKRVWVNETDHDIGWYAPELHKIGDKWYIYGAPDGIEGYTTHTMSVLESVSDDPLGPYIYKGMIKGLENVWSIDGTILEHNGKMYMVWSNSNLLIAEMADPFTVIGEHKILAKAEEDWERVMSPIAEGPCVIKKDGKLHIIYSASDSRCDDYCLGLLSFKGGDITDSSNWEKSSGPVFSKTDEVYGPGHCSVTVIEKENTIIDVLVYHANLESGSGWVGRSIWIKPFEWEDGYPVFGKPEINIEI